MNPENPDPASHPTTPVGTPGIPTLTPKSGESLYFAPELSKRYPHEGIHTPPRSVKSILVRLNRPHLAPFEFGAG